MCARVYVFGFWCGEKMTLLASAALDENHFECCLVLVPTHTNIIMWLQAHTEVDSYGSLDVFVSLCATARHSPAGLAAGH